MDAVGCYGHDVVQFAQHAFRSVDLAVEGDVVVDVDAFAHAVLGVALGASFAQLLQPLDFVLVVAHVVRVACCCYAFCCDVAIFLLSQNFFLQSHVAPLFVEQMLLIV